MLDYTSDKRIAINKTDVSINELETRLRNIYDQRKDKTMYVNAKPVQEAELATKINELLENAKEKVVLIKADTEVEYSAVMGAMDQLRQAGIEDIGLVTDPKLKPGETAGGK